MSGSEQLSSKLDVDLAILVHQNTQLTAAFAEHRDQYKKDRAEDKIERENDRKVIQKMQTTLDMAKGGYLLLAILGSVLVAISGIAKKFVQFIFT